MEGQVTKNFSYKELSCPCCNVFGMKPVFIEKLQEVRDLFNEPMVITSGYRCERHNVAIGGVPKSQHLEGLAVDVAIINGGSRFKLIAIALEAGLAGIGVAKTFVHLDYRVGPKVMWLY